MLTFRPQYTPRLQSVGALPAVAGRTIAGDLMMGGSLGGAIHPFEPGYHYFAEDLAELRRSIRKLLDRGAKTIYLGHGGPLDAQRARERFAPDFP